MRIPPPNNLEREPLAAYRQGWRDALQYATRKAGQATSEAKAAAARANGAKGGRPRKKPAD